MNALILMTYEQLDVVSTALGQFIDNNEGCTDDDIPGLAAQLKLAEEMRDSADLRQLKMVGLD